MRFSAAAVLALLLGLVLLAGCSDSRSVETASEAAEEQATTETTTDAGDGSGSEEDPAETEATAVPQQAAEEPAAVASNVSFSADIMPIMENVCARCHAPGAPGARHWELNTAIDAATFADGIHRLTSIGYMPPWPASDLSVDFLDNYSLTDTEIAAIEAWAEAGGGIDVDPETPIVSSVPLNRLETVDQVLTSAEGPYLGSTDRVDDYRCIIYEPDLDEPTWLLGTHFEPDQHAVVHHAIVTLATAGFREKADQFSAAEEGPGWTCYGGAGLDGPEGRTYRIGGWAPGGQPRVLPEGYGIPISPGDFIVVQIHYHYDNDDSPADLSRYLIDVASPAEIEANGGSFKRLQGQLYLGPAEIPCEVGDPEPLCDRDLALDRVEELYGRWGRGVAEYLTANCGFVPEDYEDMTTGEAWSSCDVKVKNPGRIVSMTGHMHELGKSIRLTLHPDTPEEVILLDIPDWDFDWQLGYTPVDEIIIEAGDTVRVECSWGRDRAPYEAVGYILWAEGTGDEMCYSSITTAPLG